MNQFLKRIKKEYNVSFICKRDSILMHIIHRVLWVVWCNMFKRVEKRESFLNGYLTTIANTIYLPESMWGPEVYSIQEKAMIYHELQHIKQFRIYGIWMYVLYLFPNCLGVFSLLAVFNTWYLFMLVFLIIPYGPFRLRFEMDAVAEQVRYAGSNIVHAAIHFRNWAYFMWASERQRVDIALEYFVRLKDIEP